MYSTMYQSINFDILKLDVWNFQIIPHKNTITHEIQNLKHIIRNQDYWGVHLTGIVIFTEMIDSKI